MQMHRLDDSGKLYIVSYLRELSEKYPKPGGSASLCPCLTATDIIRPGSKQLCSQSSVTSLSNIVGQSLTMPMLHCYWHYLRFRFWTKSKQTDEQNQMPANFLLAKKLCRSLSILKIEITMRKDLSDLFVNSFVLFPTNALCENHYCLRSESD